MQPTPSPSLRNGRYRVDAHLGAGGMADVYRVYDTRLDTPLAVKVLKPDIAQRPKWRKRFIQEAQVTFRLRHPGIVQVLDVVDDEDPPYLVMELIEGRSLFDLLVDGGPLSPALAIDLMLQVCEAIAYAHSKDVIHRDLNPRNCLMDGSGRIKVVDFGIAIRGDERDHSTRVGTDAYMPPEQRLGRRVDGRADVYALGATLFVLLTERRPPNLFEAFAAREVHSLLPQPLAEIIVRATGFNPEDRYDSVRALGSALLAVRAAVAQLPPLPRPAEEDEEQRPTVLYGSAEPHSLGTIIPQEGSPREEATREGAIAELYTAMEVVELTTLSPDEPEAAEQVEPSDRPAPRRTALAGLLVVPLLIGGLFFGRPWPTPPALDGMETKVAAPNPPVPPGPSLEEPAAEVLQAVPSSEPLETEPQTTEPTRTETTKTKTETETTKTKTETTKTKTDTTKVKPPPTRDIISDPPREQIEDIPDPPPPSPVVAMGKIVARRAPGVSRMSLVGPGERTVFVLADSKTFAAEAGTWTVRGEYPSGPQVVKIEVRAGETRQVSCGEVSGCH
jgi:serine/threonine protein kinase